MRGSRNGGFDSTVVNASQRTRESRYIAGVVSRGIGDPFRELPSLKWGSFTGHPTPGRLVRDVRGPWYSSSPSSFASPVPPYPSEVHDPPPSGTVFLSFYCLNWYFLNSCPDIPDSSRAHRFIFSFSRISRSDCLYNIYYQCISIGDHCDALPLVKDRPCLGTSLPREELTWCVSGVPRVGVWRSSRVAR